MIHILFLPGTFGTTIHYILSNFCTDSPKQYIDHAALITADGSLHNNQLYAGHWFDKVRYEKFFNNEIDQELEITTPIYPIVDLHADEIIKLFTQLRSYDNYIFLYVKDIHAAELNMLMQYYKIAQGTLNLGLELYCGNNFHNIIKWNPMYKHYSDMQIWELREWLSIFYMEWITEWIDAKNYTPDNWLKISSDEILSNPMDTAIKIVNEFKKFDYNRTKELQQFLTTWRSKQQYILDEYELIQNIVEHTLSKKNFTWNTISIISEAIIQRKLRDLGYEIKCFNLNQFPNNSIYLNKLLEKI